MRNTGKNPAILNDDQRNAKPAARSMPKKGGYFSVALTTARHVASAL